MKLADLHPEFTRGTNGKGYLSFDCPVCRGGPSRYDKCGGRIANLPTIDGVERNTGIHRWGLTGNPPDWDSVSLTPSVNYESEHWHGFITNGEVR